MKERKELGKFFFFCKSFGFSTYGSGLEVLILEGLRGRVLRVGQVQGHGAESPFFSAPRNNS